MTEDQLFGDESITVSNDRCSLIICNVLMKLGLPNRVTKPVTLHVILLFYLCDITCRVVMTRMKTCVTHNETKLY